MFPDHHDRLSCSQIAAGIQLYIDGEEDEDRVAVDAHLRRCRPCADEAALYGEIKDVLARSRSDEDAAVERLTAFTRRLAATGEQSPSQSED